MSLIHSVYFGFYLKCHKNRTVLYNQGKVCSRNSNHHVSVGHNVKYCPVCGNVLDDNTEEGLLEFIELIDDPTQYNVPQSEAQQLDYAFYMNGSQGNVEILIPTSDNIFGVSVSEDDEGDGIVELDIPDIIQPSSVGFLLEKEIELLYKHLYDKIEICFGYISTID